MKKRRLLVQSPTFELSTPPTFYREKLPVVSTKTKKDEEQPI
jgi:hypothetical protein